MTDAPLCLLSVHAHPDDEASKGAGTVAKYAAEGIRGVLVCCTGGEEGDILNPAVDTPEVREQPLEVRMAELQASVDAIGYESLHLLGYRDSGMPDTEPNARPDNFANAPLDEAVERLVRIIRAERPQVIITYGDDRKFYPHPDHVRVHEISGPAFDAAGDPDRFPDAGRAVAAVEALLHGLVAPAGSVRCTRRSSHAARRARTPQWFERGFDESMDHRFTTYVDVGDFLAHRRERAARAPHAGRPDGILDAAARRRRPRGVPLGGVRARALRSSTPACRRASPRTTCSPGCARIADPVAADRVRHEESPMPKYLTQEWLDEARALAAGPARAPRRVGPDAVRRDRRARRRHQVLVACSRTGSCSRARSGVLDDPDFTMTLTYDDSVKVQKGELDANAAFMQGRMKVTGQHGQADAADAPDQLARSTGRSKRRSAGSPSSDRHQGAGMRRTIGSTVVAVSVVVGAAGALVGSPLGPTEPVGAAARCSRGHTKRCAGADLSRRDLRGWRFRRSDLRGANLARADLRGVDLRNARLDRANLVRTDLRGADLRDAGLAASALEQADLRTARLDRARFSAARLVGADLRNARFGTSFWTEADLTDARLRDRVLPSVGVCDTTFPDGSISSCDLDLPPGPDAVVPSRVGGSPGVVTELTRLVIRLVQRDRLNPPVASRVYAYTGIALAESVQPNSLQLEAFGSLPAPVVRVSWAAVAASSAPLVPRALSTVPSSRAAYAALRDDLLARQAARIPADASGRRWTTGEGSRRASWPGRPPTAMPRRARASTRLPPVRDCGFRLRPPSRSRRSRTGASCAGSRRPDSANVPRPRRLRTRRPRTPSSCARHGRCTTSRSV